MRNRYYSLLVAGITLIAFAGLSMPVCAATAVDLQNKPVNFLLAQVPFNATSAQATGYQTVSRAIDRNHTTHIRMEQRYLGYRVFGGEAVVHVPHGVLFTSAATKMSGTFYQHLTEDLTASPAEVATPAVAKRAIARAIQLQSHLLAKAKLTQQTADLIVYVDPQHHAHWAYFVSLYLPSIPSAPQYILDAKTLQVYQEANGVQAVEGTVGGGFGGNEKVGKVIYDSLPGDLPSLQIERDSATNVCYLKNDDITVLDMRLDQDNPPVAQFLCAAPDGEHGAVYWDADQDAVNGAYSPSNDAMYAGKVVIDMYQNWYHLPPIESNGRPLMLVMRVHARTPNDLPLENAYWDTISQQMTFGDGQDRFYPFVSLGVAAHEISHGFTQQHATLFPFGVAGGLNEAFSDMAAQAAEFYTVGTNHWQIGDEIIKQNGRALRYMDQPTRDCDKTLNGGESTECSIDNANDYRDELNVHHVAGVFNKAFYRLSTTPGWNTHKAFDVMVQANLYYWTSFVTFEAAACGVRRAAADYRYDIEAVDQAMADVGISLNHDNCPI